MTLPSSPTVVAIEPGLGGAAYLNSVIQAPMSFLLKPPVFRARCTTTTGFAAGGVLMPWNTVDEDNYTGWGPSQSPAQANTIYVAQQPGWYAVAVTTSLTGTGVASAVLAPEIEVNGANPLNSGTIWDSTIVGPPTASGAPQAATGYWEVYCAVGDKIQISMYLSSAGAGQTWNTAAGQESRLSILWKATI